MVDPEDTAFVEGAEQDPYVHAGNATWSGMGLSGPRAAAGASGFVLEHSAPAELVTAIRAALEAKTCVTPTLAGEVRRAAQRSPGATDHPPGSLTPRQREILQLLADGCSAKEIARRLAISACTVEFRKYQMMESLDLHSTAQLVRYAIKQGIVKL